LKGVALATVLGVGSELAFGSSDSDLVRRVRKAGETAMRKDLLTGAGRRDRLQPRLSA
jgi:hypothetical protein